MKISEVLNIVNNWIENNSRPTYEAISHLPSNYINENKSWVLKSLKAMHSLNLKDINKTNFRKAVCSVDIKLFHPMYV